MIVNTGRMREPILRDTTMNVQMDVKEKHLAGLVSNTTGVPMGSPMMAGVLQSTVPAGRRDAPEIRKVPSAEVGKTQSKKMGQVPFAGRKY
jgi:hypothetical protein